MKETIGERLRALRREKTGLSARAIAKKIHMSESYLLEVERNKHEPGLCMAAELAKVYGVSVDYVAGLTNHQCNPYVRRTAA